MKKCQSVWLRIRLKIALSGSKVGNTSSKWLFQAKRSSQKVDLHRDFCRMAPLILLECDGHRPWKVAILSKPSVWPENTDKKNKN